MIKQISSQYSFPTNKITEAVNHVIKMLFIQILFDNTNAMECIWLFCTHTKDQNEIFFHFLVQISNILGKAW
jgi:competence transcription factor ComK